jgi:phosphoglycolate phosphatase
LAQKHRRLRSWTDGSTGPIGVDQSPVRRSSALPAGQVSIIELTDNLGRTTIIFDLDNTLVHSRIDFPSIRRTLGDLLLEAGAVDQPVVTEGPQRRSIGQIIEIGEQHDARHGTHLRQVMWRAVERFERAGMRLASVEADSAPTLAELRRRGYALGILTNNARSSALEALRKFSLLPYLDLVLGREDVPAMKPSPSGLVVARERLGRRADQLIMVGDSYLDGLSARAASCPFVAFRPRAGELESHEITPLAVIAHLQQLLQLPVTF